MLSSFIGVNDAYTAAGTLKSGFIVFGVGMLTVFAVLAIIWLCLYVFKVLCHDLPEKLAASKKAAESEKPAAVDEEPAPVYEQATGPDDEGELIAVITAAVAAAMGDAPASSFRVVSFKRVKR